MDQLPHIRLEDLLIVILFSGIFGFVAAILIGIGAIIQSRAASSRKWPMVLGQVVASHVQASPGSEGGTVYEPAVTYAYDVGGRAYTSNRIAFGGFGSSSSVKSAQNHVNRYPAGSVVQVYYNPANPADATLERRAGQARFLFAFGGCFGLIACGVSAVLVSLYLIQTFAGA